ncbi:MAG: molybdopterin-dependent oxidoreductase [Acidimicrobiales bacterium]
MPAWRRVSSRPGHPRRRTRPVRRHLGRCAAHGRPRRRRDPRRRGCPATSTCSSCSAPIPSTTSRPGARRGRARGARTVVAVDMLPNDTLTTYADVVLAAAGPTEVEGTFTNLEGRVSVCEQKVTPAGTSRPDWTIAAELGLRLGSDLGFDSPEAIRAELATCSPVHASLTEAALLDGRIDGVVLAGAGDLRAPEADGANGPANDAYSLRLVATRRMYDDGVALRHSASSAALARAVDVRLNPVDFDKLGVEPGTVMKVESSRGHFLAPARSDAGVPVGSAVVPHSVPGWAANVLIDSASPVTDVRVERP